MKYRYDDLKIPLPSRDYLYTALLLAVARLYADDNNNASSNSSYCNAKRSRRNFFNLSASPSILVSLLVSIFNNRLLLMNTRLAITHYLVDLFNDWQQQQQQQDFQTYCLARFNDDDGGDEVVDDEDAASVVVFDIPLIYLRALVRSVPLSAVSVRAVCSRAVHRLLVRLYRDVLDCEPTKRVFLDSVQRLFVERGYTRSYTLADFNPERKFFYLSEADLLSTTTTTKKGKKSKEVEEQSFTDFGSESITCESSSENEDDMEDRMDDIEDAAIGEDDAYDDNGDLPEPPLDSIDAEFGVQSSDWYWVLSNSSRNSVLGASAYYDFLLAPLADLRRLHDKRSLRALALGFHPDRGNSLVDARLAALLMRKLSRLLASPDT